MISLVVLARMTCSKRSIWRARAALRRGWPWPRDLHHQLEMASMSVRAVLEMEMAALGARDFQGRERFIVPHLRAGMPDVSQDRGRRDPASISPGAGKMEAPCCPCCPCVAKGRRPDRRICGAFSRTHSGGPSPRSVSSIFMRKARSCGPVRSKTVYRPGARLRGRRVQSPGFQGYRRRAPGCGPRRCGSRP